MGTDALDPSFGTVILFTLLHYVAFIGVGLGASWALSKIHTTPNTFLGLALGFGLFDLVFYTSVTVTGIDVIGEFGWPSVLLGNLIAGVSLMSFLYFTGVRPPLSWWSTLDQNRVFREGVVVELVGAWTVALWFFMVDMGQDSPSSHLARSARRSSSALRIRAP